MKVKVWPLQVSCNQRKCRKEDWWNSDFDRIWTTDKTYIYFLNYKICFLSLCVRKGNRQQFTLALSITFVSKYPRSKSKVLWGFHPFIDYLDTQVSFI